MPLLNLAFLEDRIRALGLKHWWVADQLRVDRKTVTRWLTGAVKTIRPENLQRLAAILQCRPDELVLKAREDAFASKDEQATAAALIAQENLLEVLAPTGKWPLLEGLIKATMQPDLPLPLLGALYNHLAIASWRQSRFVPAEAYAGKALAIGEKIGSVVVQAQARLSFGTISSMTGRLAEARTHFEFVLAHERFLDGKRQVAAALNNLAGLCHQLGELEEGIRLQRRANALFAEDGTPMNRSIGWSGLGMTLLEAGKVEEAREALNVSREHARAGGHRIGLAFCDVVEAEAAARQGEHAEARRLLERGMAVVAEMGIREPLYYVYVARVARMRGDGAEALKAVAAGLETSEDYPIERADLLLEKWKVTGEEQWIEEAERLFRRCGADKRVRQ